MEADEDKGMHKESQVVEIKPEEIVLEEEIGRGSFAKVYRGTCRGQQVAVKVPYTQVPPCISALPRTFHSIALVGQGSP